MKNRSVTKTEQTGFLHFPFSIFHFPFKNSPWGVTVVAALLAGAMLALNPVPADDVSTRYAPMARAFSEGLWDYAFHPHSGVVYSTLSGCIAYLTGLDGFRACQIAALIFWSLAAVPLYYIVLRLWNNRDIALTGAILYLACSHLQRYMYDGLRDNGRSLGIFLLVLGILMVGEKRREFRSVLVAAAGGALLIMLRVDTVLFGILGILFFMIRDIIARGWRCERSAALAVLIVLLISPQLYLNYRWSGYPVPNSRYALLLEKIGVPPLGDGI